MKDVFTCPQRYKTALIGILCAFSLVTLAIASENSHQHPSDTPQQATPNPSIASDAHGAQHSHKMPNSDDTADTAPIKDKHANHLPPPPKSGQHTEEAAAHEYSTHTGAMDDGKADTMGKMDMPMAEGGHSMEDHAKMVASQPSPEELVASVGLDDKTGQKVALDALFVTEQGKEVQISELISGPTIILPIFFYCPVVCPLLLSSLAEGVANIPYKEGTDYQIIALSFNDIETPKVAKNAKDNYLHLLPKEFDKSAWHFLTGSQENILAFTNSIGFRFKRTSPNNFVHPNGLVVVDENGTIIRYIYGSTFLGADMGMAISEAQNNAPGTSIKRLISICFNYDSEGKEYIALTFKILATLTIVGLGLFFVLFLRRTGPGSKRSQSHIDNKSALQDEKKP